LIVEPAPILVARAAPIACADATATVNAIRNAFLEPTIRYD
jgi:hypothetical protein